MNHQKRSNRRSYLVAGFNALCFFLLLINPFKSSAQVNAYPFTQSLSSYTPITGTVVDSVNEDDVFHADIPIGFSFNYNGNTTEKMGICTNGFVVLDSLYHSPLWTPTANTLNQINGMMADLKNSNVGGSIEYGTQGTAPNRVCIIQWKNYSVSGINPSQINFQVRLFEGSNCIQLCYGDNIVGGNAGKVFSVGLIGNNQLDYFLRTGNVNWLNSNSSSSFPGPGIFLNPLVELPEGLVFNYGSCAPAGTPYYYLRGYVYRDANNNGTRDGSELGMPNIVVYDSIHNRFTITDNNGDYSLPFHDSNLLHSLHVVPPTHWTVSSFPTFFNIFPYSQPVTNRNFGLYPAPSVFDVQLTALPFNAPNAGAEVTMLINYRNNGTTMLLGDSLILIKDSRYSFVNANPAPAYSNADTIVWLYANLQSGESQRIRLTLLTDNSVQTTDTLHSFWKINGNQNDVTPANNEIWLHQAANEILPANAKNALPAGLTFSAQEILYTLRFKNNVIGFTPENIILRDTLHNNLDVATFRFIGSSHTANYSLSNAGNLVVQFPNIMLPDSSINEPESYGAFMFAIKPKPGLAANTQIPNTATYYFDFQSPIQTNTTQNIITLQWPNAIATLNQVSFLQVYPNPSSAQIHLEWRESIDNVQVTLVSLSGKTLFNKEGKSDRLNTISMNEFPSGMYFLTVKTRQKQQVIPVLKQ